MVWSSQGLLGDMRKEKKYWPLEIPIGTMIITYRRALEAMKELLSYFPISWRKLNTLNLNFKGTSV